MKKSIMLWGGAGDLDFPAPNAKQLVTEEGDRLCLDVDLTKPLHEIDTWIVDARDFGADVMLQIRLEPANATIPASWSSHIMHHDNGDLARWSLGFAHLLQAELFSLEDREPQTRWAGRSCGLGTWGESGFAATGHLPYLAGLNEKNYIEAILASMDRCLASGRDAWLAPYGCHDGRGWLGEGPGRWFEHLQVEAIHERFPDKLDRIHLGYHGADTADKLAGNTGFTHWLEATAPHRGNGHPIYWEQETVAKDGPSTIDECDETARYFETLAEIGAWRIRPDHPGAKHEDGLVHFSPAAISRILQWKRGQ